MTEPVEIVLDRENARVFTVTGKQELLIIWPQPDGSCWEERRAFRNRADFRAMRNPSSSWSRPAPSRS